MDKRQELLKKLQILVQEIDEAKNVVDDEKIKYLNNYKSGIENVIAKLQDGILPASKGVPKHNKFLNSRESYAIPHFSL